MVNRVHLSAHSALRVQTHLHLASQRVLLAYLVRSATTPDCRHATHALLAHISSCLSSLHAHNVLQVLRTINFNKLTASHVRQVLTLHSMAVLHALSVHLVPYRLSQARPLVLLAALVHISQAQEVLFVLLVLQVLHLTTLMLLHALSVLLATISLYHLRVYVLHAHSVR